MPYKKGKMGVETANVATWLVLFYAAVGAALVILSAVDAVGDPQLRLSFAQYLSHMAVAAGGLAVGRGLAAGRR